MHLDMTASTWLAFICATGLWAVSALLTCDPASRQPWTWKALPLSFLGLAWIFFGMTFVLRFLALIYDPEFFRTTQFPIWRISADTLTWTWIWLTLYWLAFVGGHFIMTRLSPPRPVLLERLDLLNSLENLPILDLLVLTCSFLVILGERQFVPQILRTPLGILGGFYIIAASAIWFNYFQGQPVGLRKFFYLFPGVLIYIFSPFRALVFSIVLSILIPALKARKWFSLFTFVASMIVLLIVVTIVNDYRRAKMRAQISSRFDTTLTDEALGWQDNPEDAPWIRLSKRFHGFDSMALTINFVPSVFPFSKINIFTELVRRIIPRAVVDQKGDSHRGRDFSTTIWAMGSRGVVRRSEANISPSMTADLYIINGWPLVILGGLIYGLLVGLLESWQRRGSPLSSCILLAVFGMPVVLGIEQEFNFASATIIQMIIGLFFLLFFLPLITSPNKKSCQLPGGKEQVPL